MTLAQRCWRCTERKGASEYHRHKARPNGLDATCKSCRSDLRKAQRAAFPWKDAYQQYRSRLKTAYGLSIEDYCRMWTEQQGLCAVCGGWNQSEKMLAVDHCHATGKVRGLLCDRCNMGLGLFRDNVEFLGAAMEYLGERD